MKSPVLLADGDPTALAELQRCMIGLDVEVLTADSANVALERVAENDLAFMIVALDLPGLDGIEVTRLVHGDRSKQHIPMILVADAERADGVMYRAYEAGALDVITRPFKRGLVLAKARLYLDLHESRWRAMEREAELVRSNAEFREFAHAAAHDLRAPLRSMGHYLSQLGGVSETAEREKLTAQALEGLQRMDRMLVGMLQYAELDSGVGHHKPVDLEGVCRQALDGLEESRRQVRGEVEVGPLPVLHGNAEQLGRLFQNLLGNALKYHRKGVAPRVQVRCAVEAGSACIRVLDNGIGFDMGRVDEVFRPFKRLSREGEGSGIGLAAARKVAERHGGSLVASSEVGQGSVFTLRLPMQTAEITAFRLRSKRLSMSPEEVGAAAGQRATAVRGAQRPRVLVVDDSEADRDLVSMELAGSYEILTADSAERALYLIEPDIRAVITDYNMPGRDGIWMLQELARRHPGVGRILVSGYPDDRCRAAHAGGLAQALVEKPISRMDVDAVLAHLSAAS